MKPQGVIVMTRVALPRLRFVPSEAWLAGREELLDRVSAAAMRNVSVPFVWVWQVHRDRFDQAREMARRVFPEAIVCEQAPDEAPFARCATVRLDSDDALLPASLDALMVMELPEEALVDWPNGWQLDWGSGEIGEWGWPPGRQGPYLAIFHQGHRCFEVGGNHTSVRRGRKVVRIKGRHWLQTVHGGNLVNAWRGEPKLSITQRAAVLAKAGVEL